MKHALIAFLIASVLLTACGTLEVGIEKTPTPSIISASHNTTWAEYTDPTYRVSLRYPAHWQPVEGYQTRYGGPDGFFMLSAVSGVGRTLGEVCHSEAHHNLQPYGSQPEVENTQIGDLAACRILPSDDQPADANRQAAVIFVYPQPVQIAGELYHFFILWADKDHVGEIGETLRFTATEPTTLFSDPALGIAFDIPATWQVDGHPGAEAQFTVRDEIGISRRVLTLSVLSERSTTLDLAIDEVRGAWGPFIRNVQSITLGKFPARRVEMTPEGDRPPVVWLIVPPSGRAVGFIPRGDAALVEAALVTLRAITPDPTLAPSGRYAPGLIFGTNTGLWRVEEDGAPAPILNRPDVVLSPDGAQALYTSPDSDLWLIDLTTGEERNLTNTPDRIECCPQWWPARPDTLVFGSWPGDAELGPSTGFLTTVRVDGSDYRVLDGEHQSNAVPAPAPDGQTIAYDQGGTAYLYRLDTGPVPFDPAAYGLPVQRIGSPAWSPDGRYLAWVVGGDFGQGWRLGLGVFDLENRTAHLLHPYEPLGVGGWPGAAAWSPDGQWLAYTIWPAADYDEAGVCVFRPDGTEEHCLGPGGGPVWSPDGRRLAFRRDSALWLAEVGTWDLLRITDDAWPLAWPD